MRKIKNVKKIIDRVKRNGAVGIVYNVPKGDQKTITNSLASNIPISGRDAYTRLMLQHRLGSNLKIKNFTYSMLPVLSGKIVTIYEADILKPSFNNVLIDFYRYKIPLLILMTSNAGMQDFRNLSAYKLVLTIEQDYNSIKD